MKTPAFWYKSPGFLSTLLAPLSLVYAFGRWLDTRRAAYHFHQPVICVGNAVAGGAGKTPTTLALSLLLAPDFAPLPHIVTRGHGGTMRGPELVRVDSTVEEIGDEAMMMSYRAPVWVAKDRKLGIGCALSAGAPFVLLDDGLQNTRFRARVNLLVVDGKTGFGNGQLLPAGPLREFPSVLRRRVDALIMIGEDTQNIAAQFPGIPVFKARIESKTLHLGRHQRYAAFAGMARPEKFFATCRDTGLTIVATKTFADHQPYSAEMRQQLRDWAGAHQAELLTTEKDGTRWPMDEHIHLNMLPIDLRFDDRDALKSFILEKTGV